MLNVLAGLRKQARFTFIRNQGMIKKRTGKGERNMLLECCVDSVESALEAVRGGADRLELCGNLLIGGTTPDRMLFLRVKELVSIPVNVLLRPRFGDFCYTGEEFRILEEDVRWFAAAGADGIVTGVLRPDGTVDESRMERLMKAAAGLPVTFHRAFDVTRDPFEALEACRHLGVTTILTSGQRETALLGKELLRELAQRAGEITIMAGSGVNAGTLPELLETGVEVYHMSAKKVVDSEMTFRKEGVPMGLPMMSEYVIWRCDGDEVARAKEILACHAAETREKR